MKKIITPLFRLLRRQRRALGAVSLLATLGLGAGLAFAPALPAAVVTYVAQPEETKETGGTTAVADSTGGQATSATRSIDSTGGQATSATRSVDSTGGQASSAAPTKGSGATRRRAADVIPAWKSPAAGASSQAAGSAGQPLGAPPVAEQAVSAGNESSPPATLGNLKRPPLTAVLDSSAGRTASPMKSIAVPTQVVAPPAAPAPLAVLPPLPSPQPMAAPVAPPLVAVPATPSAPTEAPVAKVNSPREISPPPTVSLAPSKDESPSAPARAHTPTVKFVAAQPAPAVEISQAPIAAPAVQAAPVAMKPVAPPPAPPERAPTPPVAPAPVVSAPVASAPIASAPAVDERLALREAHPWQVPVMEPREEEASGQIQRLPSVEPQAAAVQNAPPYAPMTQPAAEQQPSHFLGGYMVAQPQPSVYRSPLAMPVPSYYVMMPQAGSPYGGAWGVMQASPYAGGYAPYAMGYSPYGNWTAPSYTQVISVPQGSLTVAPGFGVAPMLSTQPAPASDMLRAMQAEPRHKPAAPVSNAPARLPRPEEDAGPLPTPPREVYSHEGAAGRGDASDLIRPLPPVENYLAADPDSPPMPPGAAGAGGGAAAQEPSKPLGREPANTSLEFLRSSTVLLEPGRAELDWGLEYVFQNTPGVVIYDINSNGIFNPGTDVAAVERLRNRQLFVPLALRIGWSEHTQIFASLPVGGGLFERADIVDNTFSSVGGLGDLRFGFNHLWREHDDVCPDVIVTFAATAPTGANPYNRGPFTAFLGEGFWGLSLGMTVIKSIDPVVLFGGVNYSHRFSGEFLGTTVDPGERFSYQFGAGFAVNDSLTFSTTLQGTVETITLVNHQAIPDSSLEPITLRMALTAFVSECRVVEPFVRFGLTQDAPQVDAGVIWTHRF